MQYLLCRHIKTNGTQCEAPSLRGEPWCFFHSRLHQRHERFRPVEDVAEPNLLRTQHVRLDAIEDRDSVQVALSVVLNALASGQMESRRATALLYGLQIASSNLARLNSKPHPPSVVLTAEPTPEGHFLAAPGAVYEDEGTNFVWEEDESDEEDETDD
jgi:hypothetical protein